jgi:hypothetical protein
MVTRQTVVVLVVQAAVLTWLAAILPTWQDEEFTLATTAHGVGYAIHRALTYELQAPLYFALLAALRTLGDSVFVAREFSVAADLGTTLVCAAIARRIWPERDPWILCALVALNPFGVFAGLEIRTYALALLEDAALIALFFEGFFYDANRRARIAFVVLAAVGLYTQYFIAFELVALFAALVVKGRVAPAIAYTIASTIAVAAFVPIAFMIRGQANDALSIEPSIAPQFGGMLLHPVNLILANDYAHSGGELSTIGWMLARLVILSAIVLGRPRLDRNGFALVSIVVVVDLIYVFISDVEKLNLVVPRHFVALFFPEVIALYAIVAAFTGPWAARAAGVIALFIGLSAIQSLATTYGAGAKLGDAARVAAYLTQNATTGDAIAVYPGDGVPAIARYYRGPLAIAGYPVPLDETTYHVDAALVRSAAEANAAFDRLPRARHLWFATLGTCEADNIHGCATVRSVMKKRYTVVSDRSFYQADVFELEPKSNP